MPIASRKTSACAIRSRIFANSVASGWPVEASAPATRSDIDDADERASRTEALRAIGFFRIFLLVTAGKRSVAEEIRDRDRSADRTTSFGLPGHEQDGAPSSGSGDRELHRRWPRWSHVVLASWPALHWVAASLAKMLVRWCLAHCRSTVAPEHAGCTANRRSGCFWQLREGVVGRWSVLR